MIAKKLPKQLNKYDFQFGLSSNSCRYSKRVNRNKPTLYIYDTSFNLVNLCYSNHCINLPLLFYARRSMIQQQKENI